MDIIDFKTEGEQEIRLVIDYMNEFSSVTLSIPSIVVRDWAKMYSVALYDSSIDADSFITEGHCVVEDIFNMEFFVSELSDDDIRMIIHYTNTNDLDGVTANLN